MKLTKLVNANSPGERLKRLDRNLIEKLAFVCRGELMPMVSFLGGIAAQEVLKSCTGKFHPLKQFLFFDALECLPPNDQLPPPQLSDHPQVIIYLFIVINFFARDIRELKCVIEAILVQDFNSS